MYSTSSRVSSEDLYNHVLSTKRPHLQQILSRSNNNNNNNTVHTYINNESTVAFKSIVNIPIIVDQQVICILEGLFSDSELTIPIIFEKYSWYIKTIETLSKSLINKLKQTQPIPDSLIISSDVISSFKELSLNITSLTEEGEGDSNNNDINDGEYNIITLSKFYSKLVEILYSSISSDHYLDIGVFYIHEDENIHLYNGYIIYNSPLQHHHHHQQQQSLGHVINR